MTIDAARAGFRVGEVELDLEHRATGRTLRGFLHRARQLRDFAGRVVSAALTRRRCRPAVEAGSDRRSVGRGAGARTFRSCTAHPQRRPAALLLHDRGAPCMRSGRRPDPPPPATVRDRPGQHRRGRWTGQPAPGAAPAGIGSAPMLLAIDQGTTGTTCLVFDARGRADRPRLPRVRASTSRGRAGSSTTPRRSGTSRTPSPARRSTTPALRPGELDGDRHHQPARDGLRLGPVDRRAAAPRARVAGPAHGRRAATSCAQPGHEPLDPRSAPGSCSTRTSRRTKIEWLLRNVDGLRAAGARGPRGVRHDRRVARSSSSPAST